MFKKQFFNIFLFEDINTISTQFNFSVIYKTRFSIGAASFYLFENQTSGNGLGIICKQQKNIMGPFKSYYYRQFERSINYNFYQRQKKSKYVPLLSTQTYSPVMLYSIELCKKRYCFHFNYIMSRLILNDGNKKAYTH